MVHCSHLFVVSLWCLKRPKIKDKEAMNGPFLEKAWISQFFGMLPNVKSYFVTPLSLVLKKRARMVFSQTNYYLIITLSSES